MPERGAVPIPGLFPELSALPPNCAFAPRCPERFEPCTATVPELVPLPQNGGTCRCFLYAAR